MKKRSERGGVGMCCSPVKVVANGILLWPGHCFRSCNWSRHSAECSEPGGAEQQLLHFVGQVQHLWLKQRGVGPSLIAGPSISCMYRISTWLAYSFVQAFRLAASFPFTKDGVILILSAYPGAGRLEWGQEEYRLGASLLSEIGLCFHCNTDPGISTSLLIPTIVSGNGMCWAQEVMLGMFVLSLHSQWILQCSRH